MNISYRAGTAGDVEAIDRIYRTSFCDTFAHLYSRENLQAFLAQFTPERWRSELADPDFAFRIAEDGGGPIGYVKIGPISLPAEPRVPALELKQLYLLKSWHGVGAAKELMQWSSDEALRRGAEELYLSVYVDNHRARRFYERCGFIFHAPYTFMVGDHADQDLIMRLKL